MAKLAEQFGQVIRARRKALGLTQARLSEAANLSEEWIRRIERGVGSPSFDALEGLAAALGVSVSELFLPMTMRDGHRSRVAAMLAEMDDAELAWIENVVRVALQHPVR